MIYATSEVVTGSRTTFAVSPRAIHGQGQEAPINALSVGDPQGSKSQRQPVASSSGVTRSWHCSPPLWERARVGNGQMLELAAEAGMGKSRLVEEFLTISQPDRVIGAECRLYQSATPYFPFRSSWVRSGDSRT